MESGTSTRPRPRGSPEAACQLVWRRSCSENPQPKGDLPCSLCTFFVLSRPSCIPICCTALFQVRILALMPAFYCAKPCAAMQLGPQAAKAAPPAPFQPAPATFKRALLLEILAKTRIKAALLILRHTASTSKLLLHLLSHHEMSRRQHDTRAAFLQWLQAVHRVRAARNGALEMLQRRLGHLRSCCANPSHTFRPLTRRCVLVRQLTCRCELLTCRCR